MVLAKENNVFKTVATGSGLFKCTKAYYDAHKNDIPNNTAILITDDAAGGDYVTEDEAQTMIDDSLAVKEDNLVLASGVTLSSPGFARFEQSGNVVIFSFHGVTVTPSGTDWTTLGTLPSSISKPRNVFYATDGSNSIHTLTIRPDGSVLLYSPGLTTQQTLNSGNITYIA